MKPLIMITNDDGVDARGLHRLIELAQGLGDIIVVAPDGPRSGQSSALTVNGPLFINECEPQGHAQVYSCNGTPVDCVKLGIHAVMPRKPDLLLSGINHGSNAAINNIYSGTMGAAMEACLDGIPAIGFSLLDHSLEADFDMMSPFVRPIIETVLTKGLPQDVCLNVNFPAHCEPKGVKVVRNCRGAWTEEYRDYTTPHGQPFYWLTGKFHNEEPDNPETDEYWLGRGYGTIVPIRPDQTAADLIPQLEGWFRV